MRHNRIRVFERGHRDELAMDVNKFLDEQAGTCHQWQLVGPVQAYWSNDHGSWYVATLVNIDE